MPYLSSAAPSLGGMNTSTIQASPLVTQPQGSSQAGGVDFSNFPGTQLLNGKLNTPFLGEGASKVVDTIGNTVGLQGAEMFGPNLPGVAPSNAGLSTTFTPANALGGFAGNFLGNSLFGDDRGIGADIGGAVGGFAGGALLGQAVIPIPGVGAAIGALAGNALGGMFGGGQPNPWSLWHNYGDNNSPTYNPDGTLTTQGTTTNKHIDGSFGGQMRDSVTGINQRVHQLTGIDMSQVLNITGYETDHGGVITLNSPIAAGQEHYNADNVFYFDAESAEDQNRALQDYTRKLITTHKPDMSEADVNSLVNQVMAESSGQQTNASFMLGEPLLEQRAEGNETFADYITRTRETGATSPILQANQTYGREE